MGMPMKFVLMTWTEKESVSGCCHSRKIARGHVQKKLMTVSATDISMAMQTSQSSMENWLLATLPATLTETTIKANTGKKKLIKSAKICSEDGAGEVGRARSEEASMTQNKVEVLSHYNQWDIKCGLNLH